jgi:hypothetical protein
MHPLPPPASHRPIISLLVPPGLRYLFVGPGTHRR